MVVGGQLAVFSQLSDGATTTPKESLTHPLHDVQRVKNDPETDTDSYLGDTELSLRCRVIGGDIPFILQYFGSVHFRVTEVDVFFRAGMVAISLHPGGTLKRTH